MSEAAKQIIGGLEEAVEVASGRAPAARIHVRAYVPDPGFDVEFLVEALSMIEDGEGDADQIARQTLIAIGRFPALSPSLKEQEEGN